MASLQTIPVIDLSLDAETIRDKILFSCSNWGFFYITNHGIPQSDIERVFEIARAFFSQSEDEKSVAGPWSAETNSGFRSILERVPKEQFDMRKWLRSDSTDNQVLPEYLEAKRGFLDSFKRQCAALGNRVLEHIAVALNLPQDHFATQHRYDEPSMDNFQIMHYVPVSSKHHKMGVYRLGAHTDWGTLTLLFQEKERGLQVRPPVYDHDAPITEEEVWLDAPVIPSAILVNIGDALHVWSGGELKSTWHRVGKTGETDRYCAAYFLHPNEQSIIDPLPTARSDYIRQKYPGFPKTAKEHLDDRVKQAVQNQNTNTNAVYTMA